MPGGGVAYDEEFLVLVYVRRAIDFGMKDAVGKGFDILGKTFDFGDLVYLLDIVCGVLENSAYEGNGIMPICKNNGVELVFPPCVYLAKWIMFS